MDQISGSDQDPTEAKGESMNWEAEPAHEPRNIQHSTFNVQHRRKDRVARGGLKIKNKNKSKKRAARWALVYQQDFQIFEAKITGSQVVDGELVPRQEAYFASLAVFLEKRIFENLSDASSTTARVYEKGIFEFPTVGNTF